METLYLNSLFLLVFWVSRIGVRHIRLWPARPHPLYCQFAPRKQEARRMRRVPQSPTRRSCPLARWAGPLHFPVAIGCWRAHPRCSPVTAFVRLWKPSLHRDAPHCRATGKAQLPACRYRRSERLQRIGCEPLQIWLSTAAQHAYPSPSLL